MLSPTTLTFSVLALAGEQPRRTGLWFYPFTATRCGRSRAFVVGDVAAAPGSSQPKTWVCIVDLVFGALALVAAARLARRSLARGRKQAMMLREQARLLAGGSDHRRRCRAGQAGGFIPTAQGHLQLNRMRVPRALWVGFALIRCCRSRLRW
jgi:hypothetical protein